MVTSVRLHCGLVVARRLPRHTGAARTSTVGATLTGGGADKRFGEGSCDLVDRGECVSQCVLKYGAQQHVSCHRAEHQLDEERQREWS